MSRAGKIGIGLGAAFGDNPTQVLYSPPVNDEDIDIDRNTINDDETLGDRLPQELIYGGRMHKGGVNLSLRTASIGPVMTSFFGTPITTVLQAPAAGPPAVPGVYQHVWDPSRFETFQNYLAVWARDPDVNPASPLLRKYIGGLGDELELRAEAGNFMKARAQWFFRQLIQNAVDPAMTQDTGRRFPFQDVAAQLSVAGGALGVISLRDWRFNVGNDLEDDQWVLGSTEVDSFPVGPNMTAVARFRPTRNIPDWFARAVSDTPQDVRLLIKALGPVISGVHRHTVEVDMPRLQTLTAPVPIEAGNTRRDVEVQARAVKDPATNQAFKITIINGEDGTKYRAA